MKQLSEVLTTTKTTVEPLDKSGDISNMQVHGLTIEGGKTNTQSQSNQRYNQKTNPKEQERQPCEDSCLKDDVEGQKKLTVFLADCFDTLNLYGKEPEQLESTVRLFKRGLGRFTWSQIDQAFDIYLAKSDKMPTAADIVKIIDPPKQERKWCGLTFYDIKKRGREGQFITDAEKQYCEDFKQAMITAPEEERGLMDDAIKRVEQEDKQYWIE